MTKGLVSKPGVVVLCLLFAFEGPSASAQRMLGSSRRGAAGSTDRASKSETERPTGAAPSRKTGAANVPNPVAWQASLDRAGFSPGVIDGIMGPKSRAAIRAFQAHAGLPITGRPDTRTADALGVGRVPALIPYELTAGDLGLIAPPPRDWNDKSRLRLLGYRSIADLIAERGHCRIALLRRLNPGVDFGRLRAGERVAIPNAAANGSPPKATRVEIDLAARTVRAIDRQGDVVGLFHCSIARDRRKRPTQPCRVKIIVRNPEYLFDPEYWPEVENVDRKLTIPPGPRNPVGLCWIGLTKKGYGIHGTPQPELIGKTGSHGCFRLTNWDALRLAKMLRVGAEVRFVNGEATARTTRGTMSTMGVAGPSGR